MQSIWENSTILPSFPTMQKSEFHTDVLIIGGGIAGILCAYFLQQNNVDYILVEQNTIGCGITKNTTAKLTIHHGLIYHKLIQQLGTEQAAMYLHANQLALQQYHRMCKENACSYELKSNFIYTTESDYQLREELNALESLGVQASLTNNLPLPFPTKGAIRIDQQAQFHPLQFLASIAKSLTIYEHTAVQSIQKNTAVTNQGKIYFKKAICATHFPFLNSHGSYFAKLYQSRSYVIALASAPNLNGMYRDASQSGLSLRNAENMLLIGGNAHRTGSSNTAWQPIRQFAATYYPDAREVFHWAAQDCMSLDGIPYIGSYSSHLPNLYVASGFNKWGMTSAMVAAMLLSNMICGKKTEYASVFTPSRSILKTQLLINTAHTIWNFLTPTKKRCTHLGCALKWNSAECSWDCPCHGSRFDANGKCLDNPAKKNLLS